MIKILWIKYYKSIEAQKRWWMWRYGKQSRMLLKLVALVNVWSMDFTSKTSVNDIIEVIAENICHITYSEIKDAGTFSTLNWWKQGHWKNRRVGIGSEILCWKSNGEVCRSLETRSVWCHTVKKITKEMIDHIFHTSGGSVVVCLQADGASVMSGEFAGVAGRSENFHWLVLIHCTAHHLNLLVTV